jgi:FGGY-family pentulose kinase
MRAFLGVDVGTGSARAALFDEKGRLLGRASEPIELYRPEEDFVEQSSEVIWRAVGVVIKSALRAASLRADAVAGVGFDATSSLVALDADDRPLSVSPSGNKNQNIIVWTDHRAAIETEIINSRSDDVLRYVGGRISIEMQMPKLLWLKRHMPLTWQKVGRFFDLPDYLTYRATGKDVRSHCSLVCKWTYLGHENEGRGAWSSQFLENADLLELLDDNARRIGRDVRPLGGKLGELAEEAATDLELVAGIPVGVSIIDAHAGGLGLLGMSEAGRVRSRDSFDDRIALISGTSSCHMAVSQEPRFVPGIWGPYYSAMLPGLWLNEGGQSATGALIDYVIDSHARGLDLRAEAEALGQPVYALLNDRLNDLATNTDFPAELTRDLHVLPYHQGNRSPRADPALRGMVSGLQLTDSVDQLALLYLATIQAIAHGTRHIIETLNTHGYSIAMVAVTGSDAKNPVFLREYADATGCDILLPEADEAVLLGAAMLGATAASEYATLPEAMAGMSRVASHIPAGNGRVREYHDNKHRVFFRMYHDQQAYRSLMGG